MNENYAGPGVAAAPVDGLAIAAEPQWVSAYLYYHGDLDDVLANVVSPIVEISDGAGLARQWFFLRYWEGGNHLRFRMLPAEEGGRAELSRLIAEHAERFFRHRPSADLMRQDDYAQLARALAMGEQLQSYSPRLRPNNSIEFVPYQREYDRYGDLASIRAVERHYAESSAIVLRLLAHGMSATQRATACYSAIVTAWLSGEPDPAQLRGWTSGLFESWDRGMTSAGHDWDRTDFDERYRRQRDALVETARTLRAAVGRAGRRPGPAPGRMAGSWRTSLATLRNTLAGQIAAGGSRLPDRGWPGDQPTAMRTRVLPVLDICAHLFCNRLAVPVAEERYLRYLAGRALGELAGEYPGELLGECPGELAGGYPGELAGGRS